MNKYRIYVSAFLVDSYEIEASSLDSAYKAAVGCADNHLRDDGTMLGIAAHLEQPVVAAPHQKTPVHIH